ncbi:Fur family transcriptional regulator [Mucisphaera calidilacus]|uniref:Zinc-specific metallo-regulatory protein n=1 Tax=Mucisphaera calidilacus TaxID=2527982 RepID=A0A518BTX4_9BACT|nr:Fur family transcriptional regulator [Mucisphaera calidilacus]QDU70432.1 Zinc-specific metallo-regulatory protein [Mucisphaera calidilacus]
MASAPKTTEDGQGGGSGGRKTQQRDVIRRVLEDAGRPLAVGEILEASGAVLPSVGQATVYRTIRYFDERGLLTPIELPGEPTRYEWKRSDAHAHFTCEVCGRTFCVDAERVAVTVRLPAGFEAGEQQVFLRGCCPDCAE